MHSENNGDKSIEDRYWSDVDKSALNKVEAFGFPKTYIENSLFMNDTNHATTTYFLMVE